jgi:peptide-methionine (S)-S-oxide reductase
MNSNLTTTNSNWLQILILLAALTAFAPISQSRTKGRLWLAALGNNATQQADEVAERALFGMGCFWAPQNEFKKLQGVISATTGYASKQSLDDERPASYLSVCSGDGHTEAVLVEFLPSIISYQDLLRTFWQHHEPSEPQKAQYQSVIWPLTEEQRRIAQQNLENTKEVYRRQPDREPPLTVVATTAVPTFAVAESVHQNFWSKLRLKLACLAAGTWFSSTTSIQADLDGFVTDATVKLVLVWVIWEGLELVLKGASSLRWNLFLTEDRIKL